MRIRSCARAAGSRQHPTFLPSFSKSSVFFSKPFQRFLWRFCGISRGYKGSKPKVSPSKFFAVRAADGASSDWRGDTFRAIAIWTIMIQSVARVSDFGKRISVKSTVEGNASEGYARITEGYGDRPASPKPFPPQISQTNRKAAFLRGIPMLCYSPSHSISLRDKVQRGGRAVASLGAR